MASDLLVAETGVSGINGDCFIKDEEKCCVCGEFEPVALKKKTYIEFVKWAQCDICEHWVHLTYCVVEKSCEDGHANCVSTLQNKIIFIKKKCNDVNSFCSCFAVLC